MIIIICIWGVVAILALVLYYNQIYLTFGRYGVRLFTPLPVVGNMARVLLRKEHNAENLLRHYTSFPGEKFVGRYEFTQEMIVIRDLELVKKMTIRDFEYFLDHRELFGSGESYYKRSLLGMKGQEWKDMRSTLTPAFTSWKIRQMLFFITEVCDQMIHSLQQRITDSQTGHIEVDCKDLTTRFANDVIASCAFGLKMDSYKNVDNMFYAIGKESSTFTYRHIIRNFFIKILPTVLVRFFKLDILSKRSQMFFKNFVLGIMEQRESNKIIRPDMIHLLMLAKKGKLTHDDEKCINADAGFATVEESNIGRRTHNRAWTDDDFIGQAVLFFTAAFETVSSALSFLFYELALNPDIQNRLALEVWATDQKNGGKFDFSSIQNMPYMDMVISELLRKWPPSLALDRICTKDYNLGKPNNKTDKDFIVRKGTGIAIPVFAFHRDPQYFPDPEKFDPERFSEENKHKIQPYTYMPFGAGPRNCIGSRFALSELKACTYYILKHLVIFPCEKTCIPARFDTGSPTMKLAGGHWLRFIRR